jgi:hypothetical protein
MSRYLVVFNTCEIQRNNLFLYIPTIENLLNQSFKDFDLVISGCAMKSATKAGLRHYFKDRVLYNWIDEILTVNVTFNKTVDEIVKRKGNYSGYIYVDSGVDVEKQTHALQEIHERAKTGQFGIVTLQTDTDMGKENWFGLPSGHVWTGDDFIMPVGKCCNLHFNWYSAEFYEYYGKILPDIFRAYCTESVFQFMTSALKKKWVVVKDLVVRHAKSVDGATAGFEHIGPKGYWNNLLCDLDMKDILTDPRARSTGFGFDEWNHVFDHDPSKFDSDGFALDPGLGPFMKEKLFLSPSLFDYNAIKCDTTV